MHKPKLSNSSAATFLRWLISRVAVIYVIAALFCLTCVDIKMLEARTKIRHLNDAIPDFSDMIIFSKDQNAKKDLDWKPYKDYFELILRYAPDDILVRQLLGFVDYYTGQEQEAITLFKSSVEVDQKLLFWSNYNLGVIYYKMGMWPQAEKYLFNAISSNLHLSVLLMQNSIVYKQISISPYFKYSLSDEIIDAQSSAFILLLSSLYHMEQYYKVIIISNLAMGINNLPHKDAFYYYSGLAFSKTGQIQKAFLFFQKSLSIENNNADVYYNLANIYLKTGQLKQAQDVLQVSLDLQKKNDHRFPYYSHINPRFF